MSGIPRQFDTVDEALEGHRIGATSGPICTSCKTPLRIGQGVAVYAYQPQAEHPWTASRLYCDDCARPKVAIPTLGFHEAILRAVLAETDTGTGITYVTLADVTLVDFSAADEGYDPAGCGE